MTRERVPWFWSVAAAALHVIFLTGSVSAVWSSHFGSIDRLSQQPADTLPRLLESGRPVLTGLTMVGAIALGVTTSRRVAIGDWKPVAIRSAVIAFAPVVAELLAVGVQDGSPNDLDLVPPHSLALLATFTFAPLVFVLLDLRATRRADGA